MNNGHEESSKRTGRFVRPSVPVSTPFEEKINQEGLRSRKPGRFAFYGGLGCSVVLLILGLVAYVVQSPSQEKVVENNQRAAQKRLNEFYESAERKFFEDDAFWESGKSDLSPYFGLSRHEYGFYFAYFSNDLNRNGQDEAQKYVYAALPTDPEAGDTAYYVDEMGAVWKGVVPEKHAGEELFYVKPEPDAWVYDGEYNRFASVGFTMSRMQ